MLIERVRGKLGSGLYEEGSEGDAGKGGGGPTFVPTEEFKQFQTTVLGTLNSMSESMQALAANAKAGNAPAPRSTEPVVVTPEAYGEAVREGNVEVIEQYHARKQFETLQSIAPSLRLGLNSVGNIVAQSAAATLPHYKRFSKEIDAYVGGMSDEMRMTPQAYEIAHNVVVGRNAAVLIAEGVEAALRNGATTGNPNPGGGAGSRAAGGGAGAVQVPSVAELLGGDAEKAIASKGDTPDSWARKLGYGDWAGYAKFVRGDK